MMNRRTLFLLAAAFAVAGLFAGLAVFNRDPTPAATATTPKPQTRAVHLFAQPRSIPAFALQRADGTTVTPESLSGHWTLVFIGFTHCPDVCPTTLALLARAQKQWQALPESSRPRVLFVTVDPDRDTPELSAAYARNFHPDTIAATSDLKTLEGFTRSLSLVFMRNPPEPGAPANVYSVDHSAALAVLDPQARMAGVVTPPLDAQAIAEDMLALSRAQAATRAAR